MRSSAFGRRTGRGDFGFDEWREARRDARRLNPVQVSHYLREMPALGEYLEDALGRLGLSLDDYLDSRLAGPVAPPTEVVE